MENQFQNEQQQQQQYQQPQYQQQQYQQQPYYQPNYAQGQRPMKPDMGYSVHHFVLSALRHRLDHLLIQG